MFFFLFLPICLCSSRVIAEQVCFQFDVRRLQWRCVCLEKVQHLPANLIIVFFPLCNRDGLQDVNTEPGYWKKKTYKWNTNEMKCKHKVSHYCVTNSFNAA